MDQLTPFSTVIGGARPSGGGLSVAIPPDWMQGRSVFGGLQAALCLRSMEALVPDLPLRTLQTTFIAPVGGPVMEAQAQVLRRGKSTVHAAARIGRAQATLATAVAVFGRARTSAVSLTPRQPDVDASQPIEFHYIPGLMPAFTQHFQVRWLRGQPPFTGSDATDHVMEVGLRDAGPVTAAHLVAIADFVPPIALTHLTEMAPGSSATWMLELLTERFDHFPATGWRLDARLVAARDGYTSQSVMVWAPDGTPVALSRQSVLVFG